MRELLDTITANPFGAFLVLLFAAFLEALGDAFFQSGLYRSAGMTRGLFFAAGAAVLIAYGLTVNIPRWDFGRLLGVYVVLFFVMAQIMSRVRFGQKPTLPIYVGGSLIVLGGLLIAFWEG
jgi:small multidrug resistance family-3 protein